MGITLSDLPQKTECFGGHDVQSLMVDDGQDSEEVPTDSHQRVHVDTSQSNVGVLDLVQRGQMAVGGVELFGVLFQGLDVLVKAVDLCLEVIGLLLENGVHDGPF